MQDEEEEEDATEVVAEVDVVDAVGAAVDEAETSS